MQSGMYIPIYTLLPYKEAVIDNLKKEIIGIDLFQIIGYSKN